MLTRTPAKTNAVRFPCYFSEALPPTRVLVVSDSHPQALGHAVARHSLSGQTTGYTVALDSGARITVLPDEIRDAENIVMLRGGIFVQTPPYRPDAA